MSEMKDHAKDTMRFRLMQDGQSVAAVDGSAEAAMREIIRYNAIYSQDGPCTIEWYTKGRRWKATDTDEIDSALAFRDLLPESAMSPMTRAMFHHPVPRCE